MRINTNATTIPYVLYYESLESNPMDATVTSRDSLLVDFYCALRYINNRLRAARDLRSKSRKGSVK